MAYKTVILGPPGTGKTTALIRIIEEDMQRFNITPAHVAMCTFTRSAARVYASRIRRKHPDLSEGEFFNFRTMHSMCARLLGLKKEDFVDPGHIYRMIETNMDDVFDEVPPIILDDDIEEEDDDLIDSIFIESAFSLSQAVDNAMLSKMIAVDNLLRLCLIEDYDFKELWKKTGVTLEYYDRADRVMRVIPEDVMIDFSESWKDFLIMKDLYDYTRVLEEVYEEGLCPDVMVLLGDEGQDYSRLQYEIHNMWSENVRKSYIAADPNQAIYRFAGADPTLILKDRFDERKELTQTYRFGKSILENSKKYIDRVREKANVSYKPARVKDAVRSVKDEKRLNEMIKNLDTDRKTLVLARTNKMVSTLGLVFEKYGKKFDYLDSKKSEVARYIETYNILAALERGEEVSTEDMLKLLRRMRVKVKVEKTTLTGEKVEEKKQILKMGVKKKLREGVIKNKAWNKRLVEKMLLKRPWDSKLMMKSLGIYDSEYLRQHYPEHIEMEINVKLGTIHRAKGMEADVVWLFCDIPYPVQKEILHSEDALDAECRVFYVGATRAKRELYEIDRIFPVDTIKNYI